MRQLLRSTFSDYNLVPIHLWWRETRQNGKRIPEFFLTDCSSKCSNMQNTRSSHRRCYVKKVFLKISKKITEKHLCQSLFFNKVAEFRPATSFKKRLAQVFSCEFLKIVSEHLFLQNTSGRLLLEYKLYVKLTTVKASLDIICTSFTLTHLFPMYPFSTSWKHQRTVRFQKTVRFSDVFRA